MLKNIFWFKNVTECAPKREDSRLLHQFSEINRLCWMKSHMNNGKHKKYAYVVNWTPSKVARMAQIIPQLLYLQGKKETENLEVRILTTEKDERRKEFYDSFGAEVEVIQYNRIDKIKAWFKAFFIVTKKMTGEELIGVSLDSIPIGAYIYDSLIRHELGRYTIDVVRKDDFNYLVYMLEYLYAIKRIFKRNRPSYFLPYEDVHVQGAVVQMAAFFGAIIVYCQNGGRYCCCDSGTNMMFQYQKRIKNRIMKHWNDELPSDYLKSAETYLQERFSGKSDQADAVDVKYAYLGKKVISRLDFINQEQLNPTKKNIVLMLHCFSDVPVSLGSEMIYRDYYIWYEETLKIICKIDNVNWIIKSHPIRFMYGEEDVAKKLFDKYKSKNMVWFSDEYSTESIAYIADAIITVQGTAGKEFSCLGIPVVLTGKAFYSGFGFTIEPKSREEYEKILHELNKIEPLSQEQRKKALKILYLDLKLNRVNFDEFDTMLTDMIPKPVIEGNNRILNDFIYNMKANSDYLRQTHFYRLGLLKVGESDQITYK